MAIPNRVDNYSCYLVILCAHVEPQNRNVNMASAIVAVYNVMSVDRSQKILRYVWLAAARRYPT